MPSEVKGLVLSSFLAENQLQGFYSEECIGVTWEEFKLDWEAKREKLPTEWENTECAFELMTEEESSMFTNDPRYNSFYDDQALEFYWVSNIKNLIPLKPFISLDACDQFIQELNETNDGISICLNSAKNTGNVAINFVDENLKTVSLISNDRNIAVKEIGMKHDQITKDMLVSIRVGKQSPYIELVLVKERAFLINGLQRVYALLKNGGHDRIPCVILDASNNEQLLKVHPYSVDIVSDPRPPIIADFLNKSLVSEVKLQTKIKQIQIIVQEGLLPTII